MKEAVLYIAARVDVTTSADHGDSHVASPPVAAGADLVTDHRKKSLLKPGWNGTTS